MNDAATRALLPEGLHDTLPPAAEFEFSTIAALLYSLEVLDREARRQVSTHTT